MRLKLLVLLFVAFTFPTLICAEVMTVSFSASSAESVGRVN